MPTFTDHATSPAPPEEVWKLLYDPLRFPDWWDGMARAELGGTTSSGEQAYTFWYDDHPDFPMPQVLGTGRVGRAVTISCLVSDLSMRWRLEEAGRGGTAIAVEVEIPESETARLEQVQASTGASLRRLARVAAGLDDEAARAATAVPRARG